MVSASKQSLKEEKKEKKEVKREALPEVKPGLTVKVYQKIKEIGPKGEKERIQVFEGIVLAHKHGKQAGATIMVRKISDGIGVEKIFPLNSPTIVKIEIVKKAKVRQAKLYYLRNYKKRLKEKKVTYFTPHTYNYLLITSR